MKLSIASLLKRIHSRHFKTSFLMLLFLSHLFLAIGFSLWSSSFHQTASEKAEFRLRSLINTVEQTLATAKDNALFAGALPSVNAAFLSPSVSMEQLFRVSKDLEPLVNRMAYDSLILYFRRSDLLYDTKAGLYPADRFFNPDLLTRFSQRQSEEYWEFGYPYRHYYDNGLEHHVLTYLHSLPIYGTENYGFIAVNLPLSAIRHALGTYPAEFGEQIALYFNDRLLWPAAQESIQGETNPTSSSAYTPDIFLHSTAYEDLRGEVRFPPNLFFRHVRNYLPALLASYLLLWLLNFGGALVYTCYHLNKLDSFLHKIGMSGFDPLPFFAAGKPSNPPFFSPAEKNSSLPFGSGKAMDEFQLLNQAADHLQNQIQNIKKTVAESKPLLQERLLTDILYHHVDVDHIPAEYSEYDISFPHPYFCVILMAIQEIESVPTMTIKEEIKLVAKQNATELLSSLGKIYSLYSEKENLLFLVNTAEREELREKIMSIAHALKKGMQESLGFHLLFSVAFCDEANPVPYYAWTKARKNLIFTSGSSDSFLIFSKQENYATALMPSVIHQMTGAIIDKDIRRLKEISEHFCEQNLPDDMPLSDARKTLLLAAASIFSSLLEMDVLFPIEEMNQMVRKIEQSDDLGQSKELFRSFLAGLIETENKVSGEAQEYIRQTIAYLEKHFAEPITMPQIAENVNISPIYLNKLFKLSTGKTLSEYLNFYRMERSKAMLLGTDMTINDISKALGYNDVRSYIRFFKKFYDVTPNQYRKTAED